MESCRCCLAETANIFYVFSMLDEFNMKISELIINCGGILISEDDGYSKNICRSCLYDLTCAARFRDRCLKSNYILKTKHIRNDDEPVESGCGQLLHPQVVDLVESDEESTVNRSDVNEPNEKSNANVDLEDENKNLGPKADVTDDQTDQRQGPGTDDKPKAKQEAEDEYEESTTGLKRRRRKSKIQARIKLQLECQNSENDPQEPPEQLSDNAKHDREFRPFTCDECGKAFKQKVNMMVHRRIHTGERPYKCSFCDKRFAQCTGLVQHERLHTGERPYRCRMCKKTFIQSGQLDAHAKMCHL